MTDAFDVLRSRRCECGVPDCEAVVQMSWAEQDAVDHAPVNAERLWIVHPDHDIRGARSSRVLTSNERYVVVESVEEHD